MEQDNEVMRIEALRGEARAYAEYMLMVPDIFRDQHMDLSRPVWEAGVAQPGLAPDEQLDLNAAPEDMPPFPALVTAGDYAIMRAMILEQLGITEADLQANKGETYHSTATKTHTIAPEGRVDLEEPVTVEFETTIYPVEIDGETFYLHESTYPPGYLDPKNPDVTTVLAIGPEEHL